MKLIGDKGGESFGVDFREAPVPSRRYAAEMCAIDFSNTETRFVFAQRSLGEQSIDSALVVRMNRPATEQFLASIESMQSPTLDQIAQDADIKPIPLERVVTRPLQTVQVFANIAAVAVSGYETCIDFYHASAFAMLHAPKTNELAIEPVVRVDLSTSHFLAVVDSLRQRFREAGQFPSEVSK